MLLAEATNPLDRLLLTADPASIDRAETGWAEREADRPESVQIIRRTPLLADGGDPATLSAMPRHKAFNQLRREYLILAVHSERRLEQSMLSFWSDHFHTSTRKAAALMVVAKPRELAALRRHSLGRFRDLLETSVLSSAMLAYLDAGQNRKGRRNENLARELLELHTLGVDGGYRHHDITEVARILTGLHPGNVRGESPGGEMRVMVAKHDTGDKEVLGHRIRGGDVRHEVHELLDLLAAEPTTARYVATKLCRRFVADEPSEAVVGAVAESFDHGGGRVVGMIETMTAHPDFMQAMPMLKRPLELAITATRLTGSTLGDQHGLGQWLQRMGHGLWLWPTPDGYPTARESWDDGLYARWAFAIALATGKVRGVRPDPERIDQLASEVVADVPPRLRAGLVIAGPEFQWH